MEDKKEYLNRIYHQAVIAGLCSNKKEFAEIMEVNKSGLSSAMNGNEKNLTDRLVRKVRKFAVAHGLEDGAGTKPAPAQEQPAAPTQGRGFYVPEEFRQTMENMSETIRIQAQLLAQQMQGAAFMGGAIYTPKNGYQTDKK